MNGRRHHILFWIISICAWFVPLGMVLSVILPGNLPFWYDPARDLLMGLDLHRKFSLIGPESGIPKIFYGPYWWWLMSANLLVTKDPRVIAILSLTIPYFTLLPFLLYKFRLVFRPSTLLILWLLFMFNFNQYAIQLWNPHLAPLILLGLIYLLVSTNFLKQTIENYLRWFLVGLTFGLLANFNPSFGLMISPAVALFIIVQSIREKVRLILFINISLLMTFGTVIAFLPLIIFEYRHGFQQTKALVRILSDAVFYHTPAVGQVGFTRSQIMYKFTETLGKLLAIPYAASLVIYFETIVLLLHKALKRRLTLGPSEKTLLLLLLLLAASILSMTLISENPVYDYHFTGIEVIFLLLIGLFVNKINMLKHLLIAWTVMLFSFNLWNLFFPAKFDPMTIPSLATKKKIIEMIYKDAAGKPFSLAAYSPAIFTYDYDYLVQWLGNDIYHQAPEKNITKANTVYLIIPKQPSYIVEDFIHYKTSPDLYQTVNTWNIADGTLITKREKTH